MKTLKSSYTLRRHLTCVVQIILFCSIQIEQVSAQDWVSNNIGIPVGGLNAGVPAVTFPGMSLKGGGAGIGGVSDSFHYLSDDRLMSGNIELEARVWMSSFSGPEDAEGGVMLRESFQQDAAFAALVVNSRREIFFKWRSSSGAISAESFGTVPEVQTNCWLRLKRDGYFVAGYHSSDGINWQLVGSAVYGLTPASLSASLKVGLCMCSQTPAVLAQASFDNFRALPYVPQRVIPGAVTSTMKLWLRSDCNVRSDGLGRVDFWEDQSGYANDAVSSVGTYNHMPQIIPNAIAGKPTLLFDHSGIARKFMTINDHGSLSAQGLSIFVVARWPQPQIFSPPYAGILSKGASASVGYYLGFNGGLPQFRGMSAVRTWAAPLLAPSVNLPHLLSGEFLNAASLSLRVDGESPASTTAATTVSLAANTAPLYIGQFVTSATLPTPEANIFPFRGEIAEIIIYQNTPATSGMPLERRREMDAYFRAKYGIQTMTLPPAPQPSLFLAGQAVDGGIFTGLEEGLVSFVVPDDSRVYYRINGGPTMLYTGPFTPSLTGEVNITAWTEKPGHDKSPDEVCSFLIDAETDYLPRSDMKLWLRADRGVTLTSGKVSSWRSQATETNYEAVETLAASMPLLVPTSTHGKSTIQFPDASSTRLKIATASSPPNLNSYTVFVAGRHSTGAAAAMGRLLSRTSAVSNGYYFGLTKSANGSAWVAWQSRKTSATATGVGQTATTAPNLYIEPSPAWNVLSARANTLERRLRINGEELQSSHSTDTPLSADSTADLWLGTSGTAEYFKGEIAEVLLYDRTLTLQEVREVEAYLAGRYDLPGKPSVNLGCAIASGTHSGPTPLRVTFTSTDDGLISYRVNLQGTWSEWSVPLPTTVEMSLAAGASGLATYQVEARAEKRGFITTELSRTFTIDPASSDIPRSGMKLWLRADAGVQADAGGSVTLWQDQSGSGNDLGASAGERPLLLAATLTRPASVSFGMAASITRMSPTNAASFSLGALPDNDWVVYAVARPSDTSGRMTLVEHSSNAVPPKGFLLQSEQVMVGRQKLFGQMLPNAGVSSTTPDYQLSQAFHLFSQQIRPVGNPAVLKHSLQINRAYVDALDVQQTVSNDNQLRIFSLGARRSVTSPERWIGDISELLIYDKPLSSVQVDALEACLIRRYGLSHIQQKPVLPQPTASPDRGCWKPGVTVALSHPIGGVSYQYRYWADGSSPGDWAVTSNSFAITEAGFIHVEVEAVKPGYQNSNRLSFSLDVDASTSLLPRNKLSLWFRADKGIEGGTSVQKWNDQSGGGHYLDAVSNRRPLVGTSSDEGANTPIEIWGSGVSEKISATVVRFPSSSNPRISPLLKLGSLTTPNVGALLKPQSKVFLVCRFDNIAGAGRPSYARRTFLQVVKPGNAAEDRWSMFAYASGSDQKLGASRQDSNLTTPFDFLISNTIADRSKPLLIDATVGHSFSVFPGLGRSGEVITGAWNSDPITSSSTQEVYVGGSLPIGFNGYLPTFGGSFTISQVPAVQQGMLGVGMRIDAVNTSTGDPGNITVQKACISNVNTALGTVTISKDTEGGNTSTNFTAFSFMEGEIAELLIYDQGLSIDDEIKIQEYLHGRYAFGAKKPFAPPTITPSASILSQGAVITITPPSGSGVFRVNGVEHPADQPHTLTVGEGQTRLLVKAEAEPINKGYSPSEAQAVFVIDPNAELVTKPGLKLWIRGDTVVTPEASNSVESWFDVSGNGRHLKTAALTGATAPQVFEHPPASGTALVLNGAVTTVSVTNGGAGYLLAPRVKLIGGGGSGASASAQITNGVVTSVTVNSGGTGYLQAPAVLFSAPFNGQPYVRFRAIEKNVLQTFSDGLDAGTASVFAILRRTSTNSPLSTRIAGSYFLPSGASPSPEGFSLQLTSDTANTTFALKSSGVATGLVSHQLPSVFGRPEDQGILFMGGSYDGSTAQLFERGSQVKAGNMSAIGLTQSPFYVGGSNLVDECLNADLAELLVYDRALTKDEIDNLTVYVQERYGIDVLKKVPAPVPSHFGGTYSAPVPLRFKSMLPGCILKYVIGEDGQPSSSLPDPSEDLADGRSVTFNPLDVSSFVMVSGGSRSVKVRAFRDGFLPSEVVTLDFHFDSAATFNRSGLAVWLRADSDVSRDLSNKVSKWRDQSGKGNDAVAPATLAHQPTYLADGTGLTGRPALQFNVTGGTLPIHLEVPAIADIDTGVVSFFAIARKAGTNNGVIAKRGGGELRMAGTAASPTGVMATNNVESASIPITANQYVLLAGTYDRTYRRISNGYLSDAEAYTTALTAGSALMIGAEVKTTSSYALQGEIAEILVYNRGLSLSERGEVEGYLAKRYPQVRLPMLPSPIFVPSAMNGGASGGTHYATEPGTVALYSPGGGKIYWFAPPLVDWQLYQKPIPVFYTTTFHAKTVSESGESPAVMGTFYLNAVNYPAPTATVGDTTPPVFALDKPMNAVEVTNP